MLDMFRRKPKSYGGSFSYRTREINLGRLEREQFDIAVIGGGITGAAIARDAAMRGMRTALIEKGDFGSGTSSKSSKMIHGGLRYLKQLDIRLVRESLSERERLIHLAPHLVRPMAHLIPIYAGWMARLELRIGLGGYDLLAGESSLRRHRNLSREDVLDAEPRLRSEQLAGGVLYYDCLVDDARLTLITAKSAHQCGAVLCSYTKATRLRTEAANACEVGYGDLLDGREGVLRAKVVVAAAGPWTDELLRLRNHPEPMLRPTKGVHIVFDKGRLRVNHVVVLPTEDKRIIFVVPRDQFAYVGTTDTDYRGSLDQVLVEAEDVHYLLAVLNWSFPTLNLTPADVLSSWAGLRPLLREQGDPSRVSRDYGITFYEDGLAVIAGGKLTTHRNMATSLLDQVEKRYAHRLSGTFRECRTGQVSLVGGEMGEFPGYLRAQSLGLMGGWGLSRQTAEHLIQSYGRNHMDILALVRSDPSLLEPLAPGCAAIKAEAIYAVEEEMALTLEDFMSRRTDLMHFGTDRELSVAKTAAKLMGRLCRWTRIECERQISSYRHRVNQMFEFRASSSRPRA
jgi:glycerol-3-phosphate dehydrogenase